jgi:hypothetical protein
MACLAVSAVLPPTGPERVQFFWFSHLEEKKVHINYEPPSFIYCVLDIDSLRYYIMIMS